MRGRYPRRRTSVKACAGKEPGTANGGRIVPAARHHYCGTKVSTAVHRRGRPMADCIAPEHAMTDVPRDPLGPNGRRRLHRLPGPRRRAPSRCSSSTAGSRTSRCTGSSRATCASSVGCRATCASSSSTSAVSACRTAWSAPRTSASSPTTCARSWTQPASRGPRFSAGAGRGPSSRPSSPPRIPNARCAWVHCGSLPLQAGTRLPVGRVGGRVRGRARRVPSVMG